MAGVIAVVVSLYAAMVSRTAPNATIAQAAGAHTLKTVGDDIEAVLYYTGSFFENLEVNATGGFQPAPLALLEPWRRRLISEHASHGARSCRTFHLIRKHCTLACASTAGVEGRCPSASVSQRVVQRPSSPQASSCIRCGGCIVRWSSRRASMAPRRIACSRAL